MWRPVAVFLLAITPYGCILTSDPALPQSGGELDEVMLVVDDHLKGSRFTDTLATFFLDPYPGLPQYEPILTLRIKSNRQFTQAGDLLKRYRNIVFCSTLDEKGPVSELIRKEFSQHKFDQQPWALSANRNTYASPQLVAYFGGATKEDLVAGMPEAIAELYKLISSSESRVIRTKLFTRGNNLPVSRALSKLGVEMPVPSGYVVSVSAENFVWISRQEVFRNRQGDVLKEIHRNIWVASLHDTAIASLYNKSTDTFMIDILPLSIRDSIAKKHIHGESPAYPMYTDTRWLLSQREVNDSSRMLETRGLWVVDRPIMGGPFLNHLVRDSVGNRTVVIESFIYAGGSDNKRELVREAETILSGARLKIEGK